MNVLCLICKVTHTCKCDTRQFLNVRHDLGQIIKVQKFISHFPNHECALAIGSQVLFFTPRDFSFLMFFYCFGSEKKKFNPFSHLSKCVIYYVSFRKKGTFYFSPLEIIYFLCFLLSIHFRTSQNVIFLMFLIVSVQKKRSHFISHLSRLFISYVFYCFGSEISSIHFRTSQHLSFLMFLIVSVQHA